MSNEQEKTLNQSVTAPFSPFETTPITEIYEDEHYSTIRQGSITNTLTKITGKEAEIDAYTGDATFKRGNVNMSITRYEQLAGLRTTAMQLLDALTIGLTESGARSPKVTMPLSVYMEQRGLKDRKEAKKQIVADMEILKNVSISGTERKGGKIQSYGFMNLADSGTVSPNGEITFTFGQTFFENVLLQNTVMPYPKQLLKVNSKKNPCSYYFGRKIDEHYNMNYGKPNATTIAVSTLLENAPLPSYDEVMAGNKHLTERIIRPFERDLDALSDTLKWEYRTPQGNALTAEEKAALDYYSFVGLNVRFKLLNYPTHTQEAKLERKTERINNTKQSKKTASKKKEAQ